MKLYATVTSERATKGQGGNDYILIELKGGSAKNSFTEYHIEYNETGLLVTDCDNNELLSTGGRFIGDDRKGEKQKGECSQGHETLLQCLQAPGH